MSLENYSACKVKIISSSDKRLVNKSSFSSLLLFSRANAFEMYIRTGSLEVKIGLERMTKAISKDEEHTLELKFDSLEFSACFKNPHQHGLVSRICEEFSLSKRSSISRVEFIFLMKNFERRDYLPSVDLSSLQKKISKSIGSKIGNDTPFFKKFAECWSSDDLLMWMGHIYNSESVGYNETGKHYSVLDQLSVESSFVEFVRVLESLNGDGSPYLLIRDYFRPCYTARNDSKARNISTTEITLKKSLEAMVSELRPTKSHLINWCEREIDLIESNGGRFDINLFQFLKKRLDFHRQSILRKEKSVDEVRDGVLCNKHHWNEQWCYMNLLSCLLNELPLKEYLTKVEHDYFASCASHHSDIFNIKELKKQDMKVSLKSTNTEISLSEVPFHCPCPTFFEHLKKFNGEDIEIEKLSGVVSLAKSYHEKMSSIVRNLDSVFGGEDEKIEEIEMDPAKILENHLPMNNAENLVKFSSGRQDEICNFLNSKLFFFLQSTREIKTFFKMFIIPGRKTTSFSHKLKGLKFGPCHVAFGMDQVSISWFSDSCCSVTTEKQELGEYCGVASYDCNFPILLSPDIPRSVAVLKSIASQILKFNLEWSYGTSVFTPLKSATHIEKRKRIDSHEFLRQFFQALINVKDIQSIERECIKFPPSVWNHVASHFKNHITAMKPLAMKNLRFVRTVEIRQHFADAWKMNPQITPDSQGKIYFNSHAELDMFYMTLLAINEDFQMMYPGIFEILKAYDRQFHVDDFLSGSVEKRCSCPLYKYHGFVHDMYEEVDPMPTKFEHYVSKFQEVRSCDKKKKRIIFGASEETADFNFDDSKDEKIRFLQYLVKKDPQWIFHVSSEYLLNETMVVSAVSSCHKLTKHQQDRVFKIFSDLVIPKKETGRKVISEFEQTVALGFGMEFSISSGLVKHDIIKMKKMLGTQLGKIVIKDLYPSIVKAFKGRRDLDGLKKLEEYLGSEIENRMLKLDIHKLGHCRCCARKTVFLNAEYDLVDENANFVPNGINKKEDPFAALARSLAELSDVETPRILQNKYYVILKKKGTQRGKSLFFRSFTGRAVATKESYFIPHGTGCVYDVKTGGCLFEGNFSFGKKSGKGLEIDPKTNTPIYDGLFLDGERHGRGEYFDVDEKVHKQAIFEHGKVVKIISSFSCPQINFSDVMSIKKWKLAGGAFGEVFKIKTSSVRKVLKKAKIDHVYLKKDCLALKLFSSDVCNLYTKDLWRKIVRGVEICAQVKDKKHLLPVLAIVKGRRMGYVMQLGEFSVDELVRTRNCPAEEKFRILHETAIGMRALNEENIMHRDLKWGNILLGDDKRVLITDIDSAKQDQRDWRWDAVNTQSNIGTASYLAPEVLKGTGNYGVKIDVYSYGMMIYSLIFGIVDPLRSNYQCSCGMEMRDILSADIVSHVRDCNLRPLLNNERVDSVDPQNEFLVELMKLCWDIDPEKRPTFDQIVKIFDDEKSKKVCYSIVKVLVRDTFSLKKVNKKAENFLRFNVKLLLMEPKFELLRSLVQGHFSGCTVEGMSYQDYFDILDDEDISKMIENEPHPTIYVQLDKNPITTEEDQKKKEEGERVEELEMENYRLKKELEGIKKKLRMFMEKCQCGILKVEEKGDDGLDECEGEDEKL